MKKSNLIYFYDGSFIQLLNLINYLLHQKTLPLNIKDYTYQPNLFEKTINLKIPMDEDIISKIIKAFGLKIFNCFYYLYLANCEDKEKLTFYFWLYSLKYGNKIFNLRNITPINEALKVMKYVSNENHKWKGFLRFQELKNKVLYAKMAPENNVLPLLVKHFQRRLKNEYWLIEDEKRQMMAFYNRKNVTFMATDDLMIEKILSTEEENIETLWKKFYQTIGIKERRNDRCRRNFMPKKYWQYIIEVKEKL